MSLFDELHSRSEKEINEFIQENRVLDTGIEAMEEVPNHLAGELYTVNMLRYICEKIEGLERKVLK